MFEKSIELRSDTLLLPLWVGALTFTGQLEKAEALVQSKKWPRSTLIACRLYLAIGNIRQSRYKQGRRLLSQNIRSLGTARSSLEKFYVYQGLAFYRFFCGRFAMAQKYAALAYRYSIESQFTFGEMISKDLWAHALVQMGQVQKGLSYFESTLQLARRSNNQWLSAAVHISLLKFRAQFGMNPASDLDELEKALKALSPEDTYSIAELLLEMIRQNLLRGRFSRAEACLSQASDIIYKHQNRRQIALLNLRMSYMLFLQGQNTQALHVIRFAEQNIDSQIDLNLWTQSEGLKNLIQTTLKKPDATKTSLWLRQSPSQNVVHRRIIGRTFKAISPPSWVIGEDPIGDLLDRVHRQDPEAPRLLIQAGYYGLLHKYYKIPFGTPCLIFDLLPGSVVLLSHGNVTYKQKGLNSLLRKIALLLRQGPHSKEVLVQKVWGYEYDPLRHDTLIYSSINKLRKLLEPHGDWISLSEEGYFIRSDVKVVIKNLLKTGEKTSVKSLSALSPVPRKPAAQTLPAELKDLNFRQLQILNYLKRNASLSIRELSLKLEISKPTATRDLSQLHKLGILKRVGKGRATRYLI